MTSTPAVSRRVAPMFNQLGPLPALDCVAQRAVYRERSGEETEEAVWYLPDEEDTLAEPAPARVRSVHSKQAATIQFANKTQRAVRALWVDFDGNEVAYSVVEPGLTRLYRTYVSHPWIVREVTSGARMMLSGAASVVGLAEEQTVEITDPPSLAWEFGTHHCFPEGFKAATKALLLAHRRLSAAPAAAPPALPEPATIIYSPPCSPVRACAPAALPAAPLPGYCCAGAPAGAGAVCTTTTTRLQVSMPQTHTELNISVVTSDSPASNGSSCGQPLSPLSPRRTISITVNTNNAGSSFVGVNITSDAAPSAGVDQAARATPAALPPPSPASLKGKRALISGFKSGLSTIKGLMSPGRAARRLPPVDAGAATPFELALQLESAAFAPACEAPPAAGAANLGSLPEHLVLRIVELAAPPQWQGVHMPPAGRRGVKPTMLACSPDTKTQKEEELEQQAAQQAAAVQQAALQPQAQQPAAAQPLGLAVAAINAFIGGFNALGPLAALGGAGGGAAAAAAAAAAAIADPAHGPGAVLVPLPELELPELQLPGLAEDEDDLDGADQI